MDGPGTITWEEFVVDANNFVRLSDKISDGWEIRGEKSIPGQAYLYRQTKAFVSNNYLTDKLQIEKAVETDEVEFENNDILNDPFEANYECEQPLLMEHHVIWSMSYGVPVLYFNAWNSDYPGVNPISVETAQRILPQDTLGYSELSQAIHPILGTTFLQLHPCKSQELLRNTWNSTNKLASWLSSVAPFALNLNINLAYCELTRCEELIDVSSDDVKNEDLKV